MTAGSPAAETAAGGSAGVCAGRAASAAPHGTIFAPRAGRAAGAGGGADGAVDSCGIITTKEAGTLDFSGVPAFLVTIVLLVQGSTAVLPLSYDYKPGCRYPWKHDP